MLQRVELALGRADAGNAGALVAEEILRVGPALAFLSDQVRNRHLHVLEEDLVDLVLLVQRDDRPDGDAGRVHVDEEKADALLLLHGGVGTHQAEDHVGVLGERRPGLLAVHDIVIAVANGAGLERGKVRPRAGLGVALAPPVVVRPNT